METRKSEVYLPDLPQSYNALRLGNQAGIAAEKLETLIALFQNIKNTRQMDLDVLSEAFSHYLYAVLSALDLYALESADYDRADEFVHQTFHTLKILRKELTDLDQEELFYQQISILHFDLQTFTKDNFENALLGPIKAAHQNRGQEVSNIQEGSRSLSKEITSPSGLFRKVLDPESKRFQDESAPKDTESFTQMFGEEATNPERFDPEITVVNPDHSNLAPASESKQKVKTIMGLGQIENVGNSDPAEQNFASTRRSRSRRSITFSGIGAVGIKNQQPTAIVAPSGMVSPLNKAIEEASNGGRIATKPFFPAVKVPSEAEPAKHSLFGRDPEVTMPHIPQATLLEAAGLDPASINLEEEPAQPNGASSELPPETVKLEAFNGRQSYSDYHANVEIPFQPKVEPPENKVIINHERISQTNLEMAPAVVPPLASPELPYAPTSPDLSSELKDHPPLQPAQIIQPNIKPAQPFATEMPSPWIDQSKYPHTKPSIDSVNHPTTQATNHPPKHRSPGLEDLPNNTPSPSDYLRSKLYADSDHPTEQPKAKKGFFNSLKSIGSSIASVFSKEKIQAFGSSIRSGINNFGKSIKRHATAAAAAVGVMSIVAGGYLFFKKDHSENDRYSDQHNVNTQPSSSSNSVDSPAPGPVKAQTPNNLKSTASSENVIYKMNLRDPAFTAYVARLDKLKVSGIANMIKEIAPQVQLRQADSADLQAKYDQAGIDYITGQENIDQQRAAVFQEFLETAQNAKYSSSGINNFIAVHQKIFNLYLKEGSWRPEWRETQHFYNAFVQPLKLEKDPTIAGYKPNPDLAENPSLRRIQKEVPGFYKFYKQAIDEMERDPAEYSDYNSVATHTCKKIKLLIAAYSGDQTAKSGANSVHKAWCTDPSREVIFKESLRKIVPVSNKTGSTMPINVMPNNSLPKAVPTPQPKHTFNRNHQQINRTATLRNPQALEDQIPQPPMLTWKEILKGYFWG